MANKTEAHKQTISLYRHMIKHNMCPPYLAPGQDIKTETMRYCAEILLDGLWEYTIQEPVDDQAEATLDIGEYLCQ